MISISSRWRDDDALAEHADVGAGTMRPGPAGDQHRLRVMRDHAGHEVDVRLAVGLAHQIGPRFRLGTTLWSGGGNGYGNQGEHQKKEAR